MDEVRKENMKAIELKRVLDFLPDDAAIFALSENNNLLELQRVETILFRRGDEEDTGNYGILVYSDTLGDAKTLMKEEKKK